MKKREHRSTSKAAHDSVKEHKSELHRKILEGLEKLKVGGTFEEIAKAAGLKPEQTWKRLSELGDKIYTVGITRTLSSGRKGLVWQLKGLKINEGEVPVIEKSKKKQKINYPVNQQPFLSL